LCVPATLSPMMVRNMVKLIGPGASASIDSNSESVHTRPKINLNCKNSKSISSMVVLLCLT